MKTLLYLLPLIALFGCAGDANVGRDGDAVGGSVFDVDVEVYDGTSNPTFPQPQIASMCSTPQGSCRMNVAIYSGQSCYCQWMNGFVSYGQAY